MQRVTSRQLFLHNQRRDAVDVLDAAECVLFFQCVSLTRCVGVCVCVSVSLSLVVTIFPSSLLRVLDFFQK